ncbi:MAG TPA: hypothetical protein VGZ93_10450 [Candidatus Methylacidiphilales bacterium]|nr:hypothetical protein [Candidatus Methylacidiphilales bacterium]
MKSNRALPFLLAAALLASSAMSLRAEDWKTTDGKVYQDVTVVDSAPDAVTILHQDGGALVPLANLPPDIQKRFNYDPVKARAAAAARARDDAANALALQAEMDLASQMRQAGTDPSTVTGANAPSTTTASSNTHHSIDDLASSMHSLKRDLSEPGYHTMAHLAAAMRSMSAPADPTHHSMSAIADSGL